jgi:hypothetical protein
VKNAETILPLPVGRVLGGGYLPQHPNHVLCCLSLFPLPAASLPLPDKVARSLPQSCWIDRAARSWMIPRVHPMRIRPPWGGMAAIHGNQDSAWGLLVIVRLTDMNRLFRQMTDGISKSCSP